MVTFFKENDFFEFDEYFFKKLFAGMESVATKHLLIMILKN
jgi:hypothetical protein